MVKAIINLTELVKDYKKIRFAYYRDKALHYKTEDAFLFPVPVEDAGSATFNTEKKAIMFMRYIRKQLNHPKKAPVK